MKRKDLYEEMEKREDSTGHSFHIQEEKRKSRRCYGFEGTLIASHAIVGEPVNYLN